METEIKKWEYIKESHPPYDSGYEIFLNSMGIHGWELIQIVYVEGYSWFHVSKRLKTSQQSKNQ